MVTARGAVAHARGIHDGPRVSRPRVGTAAGGRPPRRDADLDDCRDARRHAHARQRATHSAAGATATTTGDRRHAARAARRRRRARGHHRRGRAAAPSARRRRPRRQAHRRRRRRDARTQDIRVGMYPVPRHAGTRRAGRIQHPALVDAAARSVWQRCSGRSCARAIRSRADRRRPPTPTRRWSTCPHFLRERFNDTLRGSPVFTVQNVLTGDAQGRRSVLQR